MPVLQSKTIVLNRLVLNRLVLRVRLTYSASEQSGAILTINARPKRLRTIVLLWKSKNRGRKQIGDAAQFGKQIGDAAQFAWSERLHRMPSRWAGGDSEASNEWVRRSPPHVSTRFIAPSESFVHWLNAIRVILLNFAFMIFKIVMAF